MTDRLKRFPTLFRFLAALLALVATASLASSAAADPPSAQEIADANAKVEQLAREVRAEQRVLDQISIRASEVAAEYDRELGKLEKLNAELLSVQTTLVTARARYRSIVTQLNERARAAFIQGPASSWEFLLGATSMLDLSDRIEYVDAIATSDADLATEVQNTKRVLSAKEQNLEKLQSAQRAVVTKVREKSQEVKDLLAQAQAAFNAIQSKKAWAERLAKKLSAKRQDWLRSQFSYGGNTHAAVDMPPGWAGTFKVCPVEQPRAYGDGFGAPRYGGGYHLHAGVDIMAPSGSAIYATFDGYATQGQSEQGGLSVVVRGADGYTYNAHLSEYSDHSTGPVSAGDIIGYVGDSGNALGGPPHNHFEYHPNSFPSSWPVSYYGYTVVGSALNPYPLLVDACG